MSTIRNYNIDKKRDRIGLVIDEVEYSIDKKNRWEIYEELMSRNTIKIDKESQFDKYSKYSIKDNKGPKTVINDLDLLVNKKLEEIKYLKVKNNDKIKNNCLVEYVYPSLISKKNCSITNKYHFGHGGFHKYKYWSDDYINNNITKYIITRSENFENFESKSDIKLSDITKVIIPKNDIKELNTHYTQGCDCCYRNSGKIWQSRGIGFKAKNKNKGMKRYNNRLNGNFYKSYDNDFCL